MQQELKEKLNAIIDKHNFVSEDGAVKSHRSFILAALEETYNLAMDESAKKITDLDAMNKTLFENSLSMGETNKQLAKRLNDINNLFDEVPRGGKAEQIYYILNPQPPLS